MRAMFFSKGLTVIVFSGLFVIFLRVACLIPASHILSSRRQGLVGEGSIEIRGVITEACGFRLMYGKITI